MGLTNSGQEKDGYVGMFWRMDILSVLMGHCYIFGKPGVGKAVWDPILHSPWNVSVDPPPLPPLSHAHRLPPTLAHCLPLFATTPHFLPAPLHTAFAHTHTAPHTACHHCHTARARPHPASYTTTLHTHYLSARAHFVHAFA